ncbi:MAG: hypothetical protein KGI71_02735 [Patescibacteria group bacterium]|nr:hypothetical protein [Patescibacteria group bacterium]
MTVADLRGKCKNFLTHLSERKAALPRDVIILGVLVFASLLSFGLGYLAGIEAGQGSNAVNPISVAPTSAAEQVVASKNGTKYYPPSCAAAARITDANKVWFVSASAAEAAGYTLSTNCE